MTPPYFDGVVGPLPFTWRLIHLPNDISCVNGGNEVINHSQNTPHNNCLNATNMQLLAGYNCGVNSIDYSRKDESIRVFPMPFDDYISIESENDIISDVSIYDISGRIIKQMNDLKMQNLKIETTDFLSGFYLLQISDTQYTTNHYIIKQ